MTPELQDRLERLFEACEETEEVAKTGNWESLHMTYVRRVYNAGCDVYNVYKKERELETAR